jgi:hypothetical protein
MNFFCVLLCFVLAIPLQSSAQGVVQHPDAEKPFTPALQPVEYDDVGGAGEMQETLPLAGPALSIPSDPAAEERNSPVLETRQRSLVFRNDVDSLANDSLAFDTFAPASGTQLLPDRMSFMERGLWGENGFFRNIGIASPLTPDVRKHELAVRRTMLTMHQIGGFLSLGSMIATAYFGQRALDHSQRTDRDLHQTFVVTTISLYSATALLSVLSPPPLIRRDDETSTTTIHKTLAWIHAAGMIITPILGAAINRRGASYYQKARVHQVSGYITTAVFAASMIVVTF